jgi:hypothetical protein
MKWAQAGGSVFQCGLLKSRYGTTPNQSCHGGSRFTLLLTADAEPLRASACGLPGSVWKVLSYGNSYHVVSRVVTIVSMECVAMNIWAKMSSAQTTEAAGYTETIYTASHSRAHWSSEWWSWEPRWYWHNYCRLWSAVRGSVVNESRYSPVSGSQWPAFGICGDELYLEVILLRWRDWY